MAIERLNPEMENAVLFSFSTKEEFKEAIGLVLPLVAGECGDYVAVGPDDAKGRPGYIGVSFQGDTNVLAGIIFISHKFGLGDVSTMSLAELREMLYPYTSKHRWLHRPAKQAKPSQP